MQVEGCLDDYFGDLVFVHLAKLLVFSSEIEHNFLTLGTMVFRAKDAKFAKVRMAGIGFL